MLKFSMSAFFLAGFAPVAWAQDLTVSLASGKAEVVLGDDLDLEVGLHNGGASTVEIAEPVLEDRSFVFEIVFEAAPGKSKTFVLGAVRPDPHAAERVGPAKVSLGAKKSLQAAFRVPTLRAGTMKVTAIYKGAAKEAKSAPLSLKVAPRDGAQGLAAQVSTSQGDFRIDLLPEEAPLGVSHFISLVKRGFYDGMNVQMIVRNAWFKTGCPYDNGFGHAGFAFKSEAETQTVAHEAGTVALCQNLKGGFAGSQFFVNASRQQAFDKKYAVIGRTAALDVVQKIAGLETDKSTDRPLKDEVRIREIRIVPAK
jgi:peptidyl-prolyl cis-trans isomerase B (cyclophilin B)